MNDKRDELLRVLAQDFLPNDELVKLCTAWDIEPVYGSLPCSGQWIKTVHRDMTIQRLAQHALAEDGEN